MITPMPIARVFFDVDDTLVTWDYRLRPYAREVITALVERGFEVHIWSGRGARTDVVERHGLGALISGCYPKPLYRHRERLAELGIPCVPDHAVDDHQEIVETFGGTLVPPPATPLAEDRHLLQVLRDLQARYNLDPGFSLPETGSG